MKELAATIEILKESKDFFSFDIFLINKMGMHSSEIKRSEEITEEIRQNAYHEFMRRIGVNRVAAMQTIQKWFGIHGKTVPDRETLIKSIFSLKLSWEEAEEYLVSGLGEPGFQINDYREVSFLYSLQQQYTYDEALRFIDEFEEQFIDATKILVHNDTNKLWKIFMDKKDLNREAFLEWMLENAGYFKGYSMTVLNYLQAFKQEILSEIKMEAEMELERLLNETLFYRWEEKKGYSQKERKKTILRFLDASICDPEEKVSYALADNIKELLKITEIPTDSNLELLLELYASVVENKNIKKETRKTAGEIGWTLLDNKYLSEMLNIGHQKEKQLRLNVLRKQLEKKVGIRLCSKEMMDQAVLCGYSEKKKPNIASLRVWVERSLLQTGRRIRLIQRQDLLPLMLTVAQFRYLYQLKESTEEYQMEEGRRLFKELADTTLTACDMERLDVEKYKLDALLWNCFQKDEMYSVSDVLEIL